MKISKTPNQKNNLNTQYPLSGLSSWKLILFLQSGSLTVCVPIPSGMEPDPNPGMDDHLLSRFCCFVAAGCSIAGEGALGVDWLVAVVCCVLFVLLVLAEEPVVLGDW
jgi:hypothetical protein